ncbi:MAG TPA: hypothetical protein VKH35_10070 [Thermoanaerobaculia bacterium]|nr:hypothetical protein [Thermoanaerobaculia bacterium]
MSEAGLKEVFRGDLSSVELAGAVLEDLGIATHRRWEFAGGMQLTANEAALVPGQTAVLLVPTVAWDEAKEALARFEDPEAEYFNELTVDLEQNKRKRRVAAGLTLFVLFFPLALAIVLLAIVVIGSFFQ